MGKCNLFANAAACRSARGCAWDWHDFKCERAENQLIGVGILVACIIFVCVLCGACWCCFRSRHRNDQEPKSTAISRKKPPAAHPPYPPPYPHYGYPPPPLQHYPQYQFPMEGGAGDNGIIQLNKEQMDREEETQRAATASELGKGTPVAESLENNIASNNEVKLTVQTDNEEKRHLKESLDAERKRVAELTDRVQWLNEALRKREAEAFEK